MTADAIRNWMVDKLAHALVLDRSKIDVHVPLPNYGIDSISALSIAGDLEDLLDRPIPSTMLWDFPTIDELARHLGRPD